MIDSRTAPYAALVLRVSMGLLLLAHAGLKFFVFTPAGTAHYFASLGLPGWLGPAVILLETVTGVALVLGVWTRLAALVVIPDLIGAVLLVHLQNGFFFTAKGGGFEYPLFWAITLFVQVLLGDGALALVPTPGYDRLSFAGGAGSRKAA
ncbi:MAG: DoxX family protein [Rhodospirillales bacterium]|nr:DoxX family protein [Rhodospirillales bacterium]